MSDLPNLSNPEISRHSLVLGFAYSLTPEGSPGIYNEQIADQLKTVILSAGKQAEVDRPWIGMQWEIFDALEIGWNDQGIELLDIVPLSHVGSPPFFLEDDVLEPKAIVSQLKMCYEDLLKQKAGQKLTKPSTHAGRMLAGEVAQLVKQVGYQADQQGDTAIFDAAMFDAIKLVQYFNRLLKDPCFHQDFYDDDDQAILELHDLYRTNVGSVGVEKRQLPKKDQVLRRFQKVRVNRFIIEAIFPDDRVLKRGKYLSTRGVLDQVTRVIEEEGGRDIKYALVYGHPEHSPRCRRQLIEAAWAAGWNLEPDRVYDVHKGQKWPWDPTTAQMWCRSKKNWDDYERMGKARLD